ncbi:hypothetical protein PISMIDRAFT_446331 [Pisolithus microcarpus 441]|uniref:Uncharacterized protein n=1 Tax=Pisolithus microcarpus 441 TaxID=765257 RepID=A0A0D0A697_9AGAM|nr:hypothetical protein PISMIDRAFT_446331 [Pisolithus microcarpus 441]
MQLERAKRVLPLFIQHWHVYPSSEYARSSFRAVVPSASQEMIRAMEGRSEFRDFCQNARLDSCEVVEIGCGMFLVTYTLPIIIEKIGNLGSDKILERLASRERLQRDTYWQPIELAYYDLPAIAEAVQCTSIIGAKKAVSTPSWNTRRGGTVTPTWRVQEGDESWMCEVDEPVLINPDACTPAISNMCLG